MTESAQWFMRPDGPQRAACLWIEPAGAGAEGRFVIRKLLGASRSDVETVAVLGPYAETEARAVLEVEHAALEGAGWIDAIVFGLVQSLTSNRLRTRALAILRAGRSGRKELVPEILAGLGKAEAPSALEAIGLMGAQEAAGEVREYAERLHLSRRRPAVEALRKLDDPALEGALNRARGRLPEPVAAALLDAEAEAAAAGRLEIDATRWDWRLWPGETWGGERQTQLEAAMRSLKPSERGPAVDALYEIGTGPSVRAALMAISEFEAFEKASVWRYIKSVWKRALYRDDWSSASWLCVEIDRRGRATRGGLESVKSGLDGVTRMTPIFHSKTQDYVRRRSWRALQSLAERMPDRYAWAAALVLTAHRFSDQRAPEGKEMALSRAYLAAKVMVGGDKTGFPVRTSPMRIERRKAPSKDSLLLAPVTAAWAAECWAKQPVAFLLVVVRAEAPSIMAFGVEGLKRYPEAWRLAPAELLVQAAFSSNDSISNQALEELGGRGGALGSSREALDFLLDAAAGIAAAPQVSISAPKPPKSGADKAAAKAFDWGRWLRADAERRDAVEQALENTTLESADLWCDCDPAAAIELLTSSDGIRGGASTALETRFPHWLEERRMAWARAGFEAVRRSGDNAFDAARWLSGAPAKDLYAAVGGELLWEAGAPQLQPTEPLAWVVAAAFAAARVMPPGGRDSAIGLALHPSAAVRVCGRELLELDGADRDWGILWRISHAAGANFSETRSWAGAKLSVLVTGDVGSDDPRRGERVSPLLEGGTERRNVFADAAQRWADFLDHPFEEVRRAAVDAFRGARTPELDSQLRACLADTAHADVRRLALEIINPENALPVAASVARLCAAAIFALPGSRAERQRAWAVIERLAFAEEENAHVAARKVLREACFSSAATVRERAWTLSARLAVEQGKEAAPWIKVAIPV